MFKGYKEYKYLYETHMHTSQGSKCGRSTGWEMAKAYKEYGYAGIIITDHNWGGNTNVSKFTPWKKWIDCYKKGYEDALAYGKKHDLDVFWGMEAGWRGTEVLIYGLTPEWFKEHPEIKKASLTETCEMVRAAGGFAVHAHPYREEWYIPKILLYPEYVDAVEGINATHSNSKSKGHNDPAFDERAIKYANEHSLPMTAGSDMHISEDIYGGGVIFKHRLKDIQDYKSSILAGDYVLTNGEVIYDRFGNVLETL